MNLEVEIQSAIILSEVGRGDGEPMASSLDRLGDRARCRQALPPFNRLLLLAPAVVELDDPLARFRNRVPGVRWDFELAGFQTFIAMEQKGLGLRVLFLSEQARYQ
jgi:hypothetical protein